MSPVIPGAVDTTNSTRPRRFVETVRGILEADAVTLSNPLGIVASCGTPTVAAPPYTS